MYVHLYVIITSMVVGSVVHHSNILILDIIMLLSLSIHTIAFHVLLAQSDCLSLSIAVVCFDIQFFTFLLFVF